MKIIYNNFLPFKGFLAMNLFGFLFARKGSYIDAVTINHEEIHTKQMKELLYVFFYLLYAIEWLVKVFIYLDVHKAYRNISFEREAYNNEKDMYYLINRKPFSWICLL